MGGKVSKVLKESKRVFKDVVLGEAVRDKLHQETKKGFDEARGATAKKKQKREAERIAAIPEAEATQGMAETSSLLQRRGRRSTKLGGRSLLG